MNDPKSYSINPTCYEKSTPVSRANTDLDRHSKDSKKVNLVPENQPESSERQPADKKELRASLTAVKTGSYHPTLTALAAENPVVKTGSYHPALTALAENPVVKTGSYHPALTALAAENPVVKTGSYHPTLTALAENDDTTNADLDYRYKKSAAGTEEKEIKKV